MKHDCLTCQFYWDDCLCYHPKVVGNENDTRIQMDEKAMIYCAHIGHVLWEPANSIIPNLNKMHWISK